jgi:16S rRNA (cytosine967-C5)-methyltransferase
LNSTSESDFINLLINDISIETNVTISSIKDWLSVTKSFVKELENHIKLHPNDLKNVELRYSFPQNLLAEIGKTNIDTIEYANKTIEPASVNLRVNTTNSSKDEIELMLSSMNISYVSGILSPDSIILTERAKIDNTLEYKSGKFEIQDEGSQLIGFACNPSITDKILDACAGAGGKSLHLADLTQGNADIVAADVEYNRLRELKIRASRSGLNNISALHIKAPDLASLKSTFSGIQFDLVLIDAPCSGMGTIRRDPMKKLRLSDKLLARLSEKQKRILSDYSNFVKPGGTLVYATCSVMPQENQDVVDYFLQNNPNFAPDPLKPHFQSHGIELQDLDDHDFSYTTKTYVHNCDGFFMARLRKVY